MKKHIIIVTFIITCCIILATIVTASLSTQQITADIVDFKIIINGEEYEFNQPIVTIEDKTYLPIREFCNAVGYSINWDEEGREVSMRYKQELTFNDKLETSREGTLENGRKYMFHGNDEQNFNIQNYIEEMELFASKIYDMKIQGETIKAIAEKVESLFGLDNVAPDEAGIIVYSDMEAESLVFMEDYYGVPQPGGFNIIVVNYKNGLTTMYSSRAA